MKSTLTRTVVATALITVASGAFAHEDYSEGGTTHWLEHVQSTTGQPSERQLARYGYASSAAPVRGVAVDKDTRHINVVRLETITIRVADKSVDWTFDTLGTASFPLSKIIPGVEGVTVYVAENPTYRGG